MGVSTDGILAFGFDCGFEDTDYPEWLEPFLVDDSFDFDEWLIKDTPDWRSGMPDDEAKALWARRGELKAACPIEFVTHCSYEVPMYILAIRGYSLTASRGSATEVNLIQPAQERVDAAKAFCEQHGIPWQEPKWLLASLWG